MKLFHIAVPKGLILLFLSRLQHYINSKLHETVILFFNDALLLRREDKLKICLRYMGI